MTTFAVVLPPDKDDRDCPDRPGRHAHLYEDVYCSCGAVVVLEISPISERGSTGESYQYPIVYQPSGEWLVTCPNCGAEHVLVEATLPCEEYRPHTEMRGLNGEPFCVCGFERRQHG